MPKINELFVTLRDMVYFSVVDLEDAFFNIDIDEKDREKTTFYSGQRLMQFKKMPQGFKNSPAIFQRAMSLVLEGLMGTKCLVYIDDILIFGKSEDEHEKNFREVIERLRIYDLKENQKKRIYKVNEVVFLGYTISFNKITPNVVRKQGILDYKTPKTKKELQRFLGFINYDRIFVRNITEKLKPLYRLLEKGKKFEWDEDSKNSFEKIKKEWGEQLELQIPDMDIPFKLETDASDIGLGAVLLQNDKPVAFISRSLTPCERNYSITEKEVLAAIWAMEKLNFYLFGNTFTLVTDHKAIEQIKTKIEFGTPRIARWFERIEKYQFEVEFRKGTDLIAADALSRAPPENMEGEGKTDKISDIRMRVLEEHSKLAHRKTIMKNLHGKGINIPPKELSEILQDCDVCKKKDRVIGKSCLYVKMNYPGEKIGMDILEMKPGSRIITAIDYFSRKDFAREVSTKESFKVVDS